MPAIHVYGIDHSRASLAVREELAFDAAELTGILPAFPDSAQRADGLGCVQEAMILSTCDIRSGRLSRPGRALPAISIAGARRGRVALLSDDVLSPMLAARLERQARERTRIHRGALAPANRIVTGEGLRFKAWMRQWSVRRIRAEIFKELAHNGLASARQNGRVPRPVVPCRSGLCAFEKAFGSAPAPSAPISGLNNISVRQDRRWPI